MTLPPGELTRHDACCRALLAQLALMLVPKGEDMRWFQSHLDNNELSYALEELNSLVNHT